VQSYIELQSVKYIRIIRILVVLILFDLSLQNYGNLSDESVNVLFFILLTILSFLCYPYENKSNIQFVFFQLLFILLITYIPTNYKLCFLLLYVYLLDVYYKKYNRSATDLKPLFISGFFLFVFYQFYEYSSSVWLITQRISNISSVFNSIFFENSKGHFGSSYSGILTLLVFLVYFVNVYFNSTHRKVILLFILLVSLVFSFLLYLAIRSYLLNLLIAYKPVFFYPFLHYGFDHVFFIPSTLILTIKFPQKDDKGVVSSGIYNSHNIFAIGVLLISLYILTFNFTSPSDKRTIFLYQKGSLNWELPTHKKYGALNGGMFGLLPEFLKDMKYFVIEDTAINQAYLQKTNVLVLINLKERFSITEKQIIWDFVKNGGSLLVLGDHTGDEVIRIPYNDLLKPFDIEFNFDCGIPFIEHWDQGLEYRPHYITQRNNKNSLSNIGIGATLKIDHKSNPVIIGRYGFSDSGDSKNVSNGNLGDMLYSTIENAGDLVLVAEQHYGKGKILVFGDTSPFQNSEIAQGYNFIIDIFDYLSHPDYQIKFRLLFSLFFLLIGFYLLAYKRDLDLTILLISVFSICLVVFGNGFISRHRSEISLNARVAYIDKTHLERYNLDQWDANGLGGLCFSFIRNGYLPLHLKEFDEERILKSKILFIISPAKTFRKNEIELLDKYTRQGGYVLISSGWEESSAIKTLLAKFNLSVLNMPLGKIESTQNALMLSLPNAWRVNSSDNQSEVLLDCSGYPVAVFRRIERGGVFLIGDSKFFLNSNIEDINTYNIKNILFINSILKKVN
jgi:hypothetical protein